MRVLQEPEKVPMGMNISLTDTFFDQFCDWVGREGMNIPHRDGTIVEYVELDRE